MEPAFDKVFPGSLFWNGSLQELLHESHDALTAEIDSYQMAALTEANLSEVAGALAAKYEVKAVQLHREKTELLEYGPATIDLEKRTCLIFFDPQLSRQSAASFYRFVVPYEGDGRLFTCRPSEYDIELPWGEVVDTELHILCKTTSQDKDAIRSHVFDNLNRIERWLHRANKDALAFNSGLRATALQRLENRKSRLLQDEAIALSIGFPIRKRARAGDSDPYRIPVQRTKLPVSPAVAGTETSPHDPFIDSESYESILKTIFSMGRVLELSPRAFATMDEEALRFLLLVPLNIHYEGQATGETFNFEGKTDILVKSGGRNLFIAECLVWKGPEYFRSKIDQLLGYTSWRDTKTAIIIFNRNRNLSAVLAQIPQLIAEHPNCVRQDKSFSHETGCRFLLHQPHDRQRELTLTVLAFQVPHTSD